MTTILLPTLTAINVDYTTTIGVHETTTNVETPTTHGTCKQLDIVLHVNQ